MTEAEKQEIKKVAKLCCQACRFNDTANDIWKCRISQSEPCGIAMGVATQVMLTLHSDGYNFTLKPAPKSKGKSCKELFFIDGRPPFQGGRNHNLDREEFINDYCKVENIYLVNRVERAKEIYDTIIAPIVEDRDAWKQRAEKAEKRGDDWQHV